VFPEERTGYELEAAGMMKASDNKEDVKRFMDWLLTADAASHYSKFKLLITIPGVAPSDAVVQAGVPGDLGTILATQDFTASAARQDEIKATWKEKFGR
jgi:iron(III) transport system substrate-binding protein